MTYQEQIKAIEDYMDASLGVNGEITKRAEEAVKEMKAASGDTISRQAAIDALNKLDVSDGVGISSVACNLQEEAIRSIENLPSAQSEPSTEIQEILDYLDNTLHPIVSPDNWNVYCELHDMVSKLPSVQPDHIAEVSKKDIPSVQPERKTGHWKLLDNDPEQNAYECSACGNAFVLIDGTPKENNYRFCPNCGAEMEPEGKR